MADRTCIVTREVMTPAEMIRFVAGPDNQVVPDLKENLPGRGVWVSAKRSAIEQAVQKSLFARGFKRSVKVDEKLPDLVDSILSDHALGALGFARKAGECITGASKVEGSIRSGNAIAILHASDGSEDGLRKLHQAIYALEQEEGQKIQIWRLFSNMQLNMALGATNVIHAALMRGGAARNCLNRVSQLSKYREMEPS